jgi:hypothetical protein
MTCHPIAMSGLQEIAIRQRIALKRAQHKKSVEQTFFVANRHLRGRHCNGLK